MENSGSSRMLSYKVVLLFLVILLTSYLRITLLALYPFVIMFILYEFRLGLKQTIGMLFFLMAFVYILSFRNGVFLRNNILSFYYFVPFFLLLFSKPKGDIYPLLTQYVFQYLTVLTVISDLIGFVQYLDFPNDDSFAGFYGHFTVTQNGLSIINSILCVYHFKQFQYHRSYPSLYLSAFFLLSMLMGFYGGGLIALIVAIVLSHFTFSLKRVLGLSLKIGTVIVLLFLIIHYISPRTLEYNTEILSRFWKQEKEKMPRKVVAHYYYVQSYPSNLPDFLLGSGPGTYNSRSAFVISSPDYFQQAQMIKSGNMPYYFKNYAYSLWNATNTIQYHDGFMNQPFSSVLALLGEYGVIFTVIFFVFAYRQYLYVSNSTSVGRTAMFNMDLYRFISIFLLLLLFIDNYIEYPEIAIVLILIMKFFEGSIINNKFSFED